MSRTPHGGTVSVIDLTSYSAWGSTIRVNGNPQGIVYNPPTNLVEVSDFKAGTISVVAVVPEVASLTVLPSTGEVGHVVEIVAAASEEGGVPLSYAYSGIPSGCLSQNASVLLCTPTATGTFLIDLTVTDPTGFRARATVTLTVEPELGPASLVAQPSILDLGESLTVGTQVGGGVGPLSYSYSGLPSGCTSANMSALQCHPTSVGVYTVSVNVIDSNGGRSFAATTITVVSPPTVWGFWVTPERTDLGSSVMFLGLAYKGEFFRLLTPTVGLPLGCAAVNRSAISCVRQNRGVQRLARCGRCPWFPVQRLDRPRYLTGRRGSLRPVSSGSGRHLTPSRLATRRRSTRWWKAALRRSNFTYSGLPPGCSTSSIAALLCRPTATGTYVVTVKIVDGLDRNVSATTTVSVQTAPAPTGSDGSGDLGGLSSGELIALAFGGAAVTGAAAGVVGSWLASHSGRRRPAKGEPPPQP